MEKSKLPWKVISAPIYASEIGSKTFANLDICTEKDLEMFLQPNNGDVIEDIKSFHTMAYIAYKCELFPSINQAKKNGWDLPIPTGFNCLAFGKKRFIVYILNLNEMMFGDGVYDDN